MTHRLGRCSLIVSIWIALPLLTGCYTSSESREIRTERPAALPADAWPVLDPAPAESLRDATPEIVPRFALAPGVSADSLSTEDRARLATPEYTVTWNRVCGREPGLGLLRVYRPADEPTPADPELAKVQAQFNDLLTGRFGFNACFVTSDLVQSPGWLEAQRGENIHAGFGGGTLAGESGRLTLSQLGTTLGLESGVRIELPTSSPAVPPRGLILYFCTLFPNEYEHAAVERFREHGWAVVCFDTSISPRMPRDPEAVARLPDLRARKAELERQNSEYFRVTTRLHTPEENAAMRERTAEYIALVGRIEDIRRGWLALKTEDQVEPVAGRTAELVDRTIAENAYAAEAALEYLRRERPEIPQSPLVVVGMSAGALAAPAVAARLAARVSAVVLVAGGADLFDIAQHSSLKRVGITFRTDEQTPAPESLMPALHAAYLRRTRLDPWAVAPSLARTPVLTIFARGDGIVPTSNGDLLWERLGRPDRTTFRLGYTEPHYELFYCLSRHAGEIARWIDVKSRDPGARVWSE